MNLLKTPLGVSAIIAILIGLFNFTNHAETANYIGLCLVLLLFTLFVHELGHALFGIWSGYRFNYLTVGPVTIENTDRLHIKRNDSWFLFGGVASCTPQSNDLAMIAKQHKWLVAGGPIFSIATSIISFIVGMLADMPLATLFGVMNFIIFCVTIIPYQGAMKSDGRVLMELSKGGKQTEEFLLSLLLIKEMMSPVHPSDWSKDLIEQARTVQPTVDNVMVGYIVFYYTLITESYEQASARLEPFKQLSVTKQNKLSLQFISHIKQIDLIVIGDYDEDTINALHQLMNPIEPVSYKRSEAILATLKGDYQQATLKLSEVRKEIDKGKKHFGFFHAEEQLTNVLKNGISNSHIVESDKPPASRGLI